jgi:hypothetical protein
LRLTDAGGDRITLQPLLIRTLMLIVTLVTFRFHPDAAGLLPHDRASNSRVVPRR